MISIDNNNDRRSDICKIDFVYTSQAIIRDYPGKDIYVKTSEWTPIKYSSATFQESDELNGEPVVQELTVKISGGNEDAEQLIRNICGLEILLRLTYSNGNQKIIGTEDNPVLLSHTSSESPRVQMLHSKRNSAEKTKYLKSF